jgi:biotin synthase
MTIDRLLDKALDGGRLAHPEVVRLLGVPPASAEGMRTIAAGAALSRRLTGNVAEIHGQFALNLGPCGVRCAFCSFSADHGIFREARELTAEEAVGRAREFESSGSCAAIFVMTTAMYDLGRFLEISAEIRRSLRPETVMVANVGDQSRDGARRIREAGYTGVYHAVRLGEGVRTKLPPERRLASIRNFQEEGLLVGTCVEPIGPEHADEEIARHIGIAADISPVFSGAMRRIPIPGTALAGLGMVSELRMAQIVAVTRLATPWGVVGNCTHEPAVLGAAAGASLVWAETGANPRDTRERTEEGRGFSVERCRGILEEADWRVRSGPSALYQGAAQPPAVLAGSRSAT